MKCISNKYQCLEVYSENGMTLIEVVVAFLVLLIVLLGSIYVYAEGFQVTKSSGSSLVAYQVAKQSLSNLKSYEQFHWQWPSNLPAQFTATNANPDSTTINGLKYNYWYSYITCPYGPQVAILEVTVVVNWKDGSGSHSYQVTDGLAGPNGAICP